MSTAEPPIRLPHPAPTNLSQVRAQVRARRPDLRIGDAERSRVCELLTEHYSAGRLRPVELDERLGAAVDAQTRGDLDRLLADLPEVEVRRPAPPPPARRPDAGIGSVVLGLGFFLSIPLLLVMLCGSAVIGGPGVFYCSVIGGSVALFTGAAGTYLMRPRD